MNRFARFERMARSGVGFEAIATMMQVGGLPKREQDAFARWYAEHTKQEMQDLRIARHDVVPEAVRLERLEMLKKAPNFRLEEYDVAIKEEEEESGESGELVFVADVTPKRPVLCSEIKMPDDITGFVAPVFLNSSLNEIETTENDLEGFLAVLQEAMIEDEVLEILKSAVALRQDLKQSEQPLHVLVAAFNEVSGEKSDPLLLILDIQGIQSRTSFGLLIERDSKEKFRVSLLNKSNPEYHAQRVETPGRLRIKPVLILEDVSKDRLLHPAFIATLSRLHTCKNAKNNAKILYEVALRFIGDSEPLHRKCANHFGDFGGEGDWGSPTKASSGRNTISVMLHSLRMFLPAKEFSRTKTSVQFIIARKMERRDDFVAHKLARSLHKRPSECPPDALDVIRRLRGFYQPLREQAILKDCREPIEMVLNSFEGSSGLKKLMKARDELQSFVMHTRPDVFPLISSQTSFTDKLEILEQLTNHYFQMELYEMVVVFVSEQLRENFPCSPEEWRLAEEFKVAANQLCCIQSILQIARNFVSSCLKVSFVEGDRVVVMAALFAYSNAILLRREPEVSSLPLSKVVSGIAVDSRALNGIDFNTLSSVLPMQPRTMRLRRSICSFLSCETNEKLWDFSRLGTKRKEPELSLQVAARIAGLNPEDADAAASEFVKPSSSPAFEALRDIALLYKYAALPFPRVFGTSQLNISWKSFSDRGEIQITAFINGEEATHDPAVHSRCFESALSLQALTGNPNVRSADDVIMQSNLTTFGGYMSEEESERFFLLTTEPCLRIPGLLAFFAAENRSSLLFNEEIRFILLHALLEPGLLQMEAVALDHTSFPLGEQGTVHLTFNSLLEQENSFVAPQLLSSLVSQVFQDCQRADPCPEPMLTALSDLIHAASVFEKFGPRIIVGQLERDMIQFFSASAFMSCAKLTLLRSEISHRSIQEAVALAHSQDSRLKICGHEFFVQNFTKVEEFLQHEHLFVDELAHERGFPIEGDDSWTMSMESTLYTRGTLHFDLIGGFFIDVGKKLSIELGLDQNATLVDILGLLPNVLHVVKVDDGFATRNEFGDRLIVIHEQANEPMLLIQLQNGTHLVHVQKRLLQTSSLPLGLTSQHFWLDMHRGNLRSGLSSFFGSHGVATNKLDSVEIEMPDARCVRQRDKLVLDHLKVPPAVLRSLDSRDFTLCWDSEDLAEIDFPRLGLSFVVDHDFLRASCSPDLSCRFDELTFRPCLVGLDRYVILSDSSGRETALVSFPELKTFILAEIDATGHWFRNLDKFAALLVFVTKLRNGSFSGAVDLIPAISTDSGFSEMELRLLELLPTEDFRPDACALRLALFEATFLRCQQQLPKDWNLERDLVRYVLSFSHITPRLRLKQACFSKLARIARAQGRSVFKTHQMAHTSDGSMDFSTVLEMSILNMASSSENQHLLVPLHAGGGWHRLKSKGREWCNLQLEDEEKWIVALESFSIHIGSKRFDVQDLAGTDDVILALDECSIGEVFCDLYVILKRDENPLLAHLIASFLYISKQKLQGTKMFELTTFTIIACLLGLPWRVRQRLPEAPEPPLTRKATVSGFLRMLMRFIVENAAQTDVFDLPKIVSEGNAAMINPCAHFFDLDLDFVTDEVQTKSMSLLHASSSCQLLKKVVEVEKEASSVSKVDALIFEELSTNFQLDTDQETRHDVVSRLKADLRMFNKAIQPRSLAAEVNAEHFENAVRLLREEIKEIWTAIWKEVDDLHSASANLFSEVELQAKLMPKLFWFDLLRMFASRSGRKLLDTDLVELLNSILNTCVALQARVSVLEVAESLQRHNFKVEDRELLLELLEVQRNHPENPRFLLFEFEAGFCLRQRQVEILAELHGSGAMSSCRQMHMGGGKSSTILPLQAISWTNPSLVPTILVVPDALQEMSGEMMRRALSGAFAQRIWVFRFSRYSFFAEDEETLHQDAISLLSTLKHEVKSRSVIVTTANALKAFVLKFVELSRSQLEIRLHQTIVDLMLFLRSARVLLDESDLLLHPLRSELNFPFGPRNDLEQSSWRIEISMRLVRAISDKKCQEIIDRGVEQHRVQAVPHVVLVDRDFYFEEGLQTFMASTLSEFIVSEIKSPDFSLRKFPPCSISQIQATSVLIGHAESNVLLKTSEDMWCTREHPHTAILDIETRKTLILGAVDLRFRAFSSFPARSGLSMVPSRISVQVKASNGKFIEVATASEILQGRVYCSRTSKRFKHFRLVFSGGARWFGTEFVGLLEDVAETRRNDIRHEKIAALLMEKDAVLRQRIALRQCGLTHLHLPLVNLAADYVSVFFPHALTKTFSVSFGLLPSYAMNSTESLIRYYLAIPFLGKDAPSPRSEFSQPDILILLSLLAFAHGGLRVQDCKNLVSHLQAQMRQQEGPVLHREASKAFDEILKSSRVNSVVLPLHLFDTSANDQVLALWTRIRKSREAIEAFVTDIAFPRSLRHHPLKLSATGEEIVWFVAQVHGFSGTPNSCLPRDLGECVWERGTEGRFVHILGSALHVGFGPEALGTHWTPHDLIKIVATSPRKFCALIDAGALITGISNLDVAKLVLKHSSWRTECVFLDENGEKMIVDRSDHVAPFLASSSSDVGDTFSFFDHVHTTGMDIKQPPDGIAALTVGNDVSFRDYAQAAFRMRRLGHGQRIVVFYPPTVKRMMQRTLSTSARTGLSLQHRMLVFLYLKGLAELSTQLSALRPLQLSTTWRRGAMKVLCGVPYAEKTHAQAAEAFQSTVSFDLRDLEDENSKESNAKLIMKFRHLLDAEQLRVARELAGEKVKPLISRWIWRRAFKLDSHQQQEQSLDSEQQQEREREQQAQSIGVIETQQPRSWVGRIHTDKSWEIIRVLDGDFRNFGARIEDVDLGSGLKLRTKTQGRIFISENHTLRNPPPNSRLRNVEVAIVVGGDVAVLSLREAGALRWIVLENRDLLRDHLLLFTESLINMNSLREEAVEEISLALKKQFEVLRFFNVSRPLNWAILEPVLLNHKEELEDFEATSKMMRRRGS